MKIDKKLTPQEIAKAVIAHAEANYNTSGWDVICECWSKDEVIAWVLKYRLNTVEKAIREFKNIAEGNDEQRRSQLAEVW
jgi:hypothetical protein